MNIMMTMTVQMIIWSIMTLAMMIAILMTLLMLVKMTTTSTNKSDIKKEAIMAKLKSKKEQDKTNIVNYIKKI